MPTPHYGQPRYRVIASELKERIERGAIPPGSLLPTESTLTAEFTASRGTIRKAIAVLREARLVATEHGRGTYANPQPHGGRSEKDSGTEKRQRQVGADPDLAAVFAVEVDTALIEQQSVTRRGGMVAEVIRTYRLLHSKQ